MTRNEVDMWLASRVNLPTVLSARDLAAAAEFPAQVRAHAFFSARVAQVDILEGLREEVDKFARGETDIASARARLKSFLSDRGFQADDVSAQTTPPAGISEADWKQNKSLRNLASTRRLDLILRQNAAMAHAVGEYETGRHPAIESLWPAWEYQTRQDGRVRDAHAQYQGMKFLKGDDFWKSHFPPQDFRCRCWVEDAEAPEGGTATSELTEQADGSMTGRVRLPDGTELRVEGEQSGYVFRVDQAFATPDWDRIPEGALRDQVRDEMAARAGAEVGAGQ